MSYNSRGSRINCRPGVSEIRKIQIGDWTATPVLNVLERDGRSLKLEPRAMEVLAHLARHAGEVVSAEELIDSVWHGRVVGDGAVYQRINQLRHAFGDHVENPRFIETIPKRGYRLIARVEPLEPDPDEVRLPTGVERHAETASSASIGGKPVRRERLAWGLTSVAALAAGILVFELPMRDSPPSPSAASPVSRFSYVLPEGQQFPREESHVVAISPDGSRMVYAANGQLYLKRMDSLESSPISGSNENPSAPFFSPDGQRVGYWSSDGVGQLKKIAVSGGAPVTLADAYPLGTPFWGADDMVVWSQAEGIMRVSANGGTPEVLISRGETDIPVSPQNLPDGESVLFHILGPDNRGEVVVESLDSGERRVLFPGIFPKYLPTGHIVYAIEGVLFAIPFDLESLEVTGGSAPIVQGVLTASGQYAVSDSGTLIYVPGTGPTIADGVLTWVDRNGAKQALPLLPAPYRHPRLSPDGTRLAVQTTDAAGQSDIWVSYLDGRTQLQQLSGPGNNIRPIWTPDSERLTFTSDRGGTASIWWQPADGSQPAERLTHAEEGLPHWPDAWSPDGSTLAFTTDLPGGGDQYVWTLALNDGAEPERIAGGPHSEQAGGADFSPDGRWIAYRSNDGGAHVQIQPFPPTGAIYNTALAGGSYPMWSRDGTELVYRRAYTTATWGPRLMAVDVSIDGNPRFTNERVLPTEGMQVFYGSRDYDITADGERFIMIFPADQTESARPRINVVLNWFEEVKERVPAP